MDIIDEGLFEGLQLPPDHTISEWADEHIILPSEIAAEAGRWRTDRAPYQRDMMDAITWPKTEMVVLKTSAQVGKTSILCNIVDYFIHHRPSPMLGIQPTLEMAEAFVRDKLEPVLRSSPVLRERVATAKSRSAGNTKFYKSFPGGSLTIAGSQSSNSLRMRSVCPGR